MMPRKPAAGATLAGAALAAVLLPRALRRRQPQAHGPALRVLTANLLHGRASAEAVVALVADTRADVLFVQEFSEDAQLRFKQAGLTELLPHNVTEFDAAGANGGGIYARFPLTEELLPAPNPVTRPTAWLELPDGHRAELVCVHTRPPTPPTSRRKVARWRRQLAALPPPADPPRVLAGDFNATPDHVQFRRLLRLGHVDAAAQVGKGLIPTWGLVGTLALLALDHILVDPRCAVVAVSVHNLPGSDHRAVYAELRLPG
jgi:endonuclease/exonuclease/phosphatase (EEP) superfamily protein YafD